MDRLPLFLALSIAIFPLSCSEDGGGPPMIPGEFEHGVIVGESDGGVACLSCHVQSHLTAMGTTTGYHHYMNNDDATAPVISGPLGDSADANRRCLMCHVDHDLFNPANNSNSGGRAYNLRIAVDVAPSSSASTFSNADYVSSASSGGLCLSCHWVEQTKSYSPADGTATTPAIDKGLFDAASDTHNYTVAGTFASDGSQFQANCLKCHEDSRAKIAQNGTWTFSLHDSAFGRLLPPLGSSFPASDPPTAGSPNLLEEDFCLRCHGPGSSWASSAGNDHFGAAAMSARARNLGPLLADAALPYRHPVLSLRGLHRPSVLNASPTAPDDLTSGNRHAECVDCHNPHASRQGVHAAPGNAASGVLTGTWGAEPVYGAGVAPASFVLGSVTKEYQLCMKCHSSWAGGFGGTDKAVDFSPNGASFHPVIAPGTNAAMPSALLSPWTSSSVMHCSDCHGNSNEGADDPRGPHASAHEHILRGAYPIPGAAMPVDSLCFRCHDVYTYSGQGTAPGGYTTNWTNFRHNNNNSNLHASQDEHGRFGCAMCHKTHGSDRPHLIAVYDAVTNPEGRILSITDPGAGAYMKFNCSTRTTGCH